MTGRQENDQKAYANIERKLSLMPKYVTEWYYHLRASGNTAETCKDFMNKICQFLTYADNGRIIVRLDPKDITVDVVERFLVSKSDKSNSYQGNLWTCLNNFLTFMESRGYIPENYIKTKNIKRNKRQDNIQRPTITKAQLSQIIRSVSDKSIGDPVKTRDLAILLLFMTTGMRKMALDSIDIDDIDFENGTLTVQDKEKKYHTYQLTQQTIEALQDWIRVRHRLGEYCNTDALFISSHGTRLSGTTLTNIVKRRMQEALGVAYSPHKLRSSFITIMLEETGDIYLTCEAVGHSDIRMTQRYDTNVGRGKRKAVEIMGNL